MKEAREILLEAIEQFNPIKVALLFSGGHDSMVNSHVCAGILDEIGCPFMIYHGDTTIGIPQTQEYVKQVCEQFGWQLAIRRPPRRKDWYDEIVKKWGFPGPTRQSHQICYSRLKERALSHFVTHECKTTPQSRENVLLSSGIRQQESKIRMGYVNETTKAGSKVWTNPIFYWSKEDCERYMTEHSLPRNPVKDRICISGECLCGAFAGKEEWAEIKRAYPEVANQIEALHEMAKANGHPWSWSSGPTEWYKNHPIGQMDMFMCVGCENKRADEEFIASKPMLCEVPPPNNNN